MSEDIQLLGDASDGAIDIEASAPSGKVPRIRTAPAYSGGKLDVSWTHPVTGERLPVVVDLPTLNVGESNSLSFVLRHKLDQPLGMIEGITKTQSDLSAEGSFTHGHTFYGASELTAARNGFKHRPSVTVYNPDPKDVVRVSAGERKFINGRLQEGAFFHVLNGRLRNISLEPTPGDPDCDTRGSILAQAKGVQQMSEPNLFQQSNPADGTPAPQAPPATPAAPDIAASVAPAAPPSPTTPPAPDIKAQATPVHTASPGDQNRDMISKMYERNDISPDIMAQAFDQGWTPKQALDAQGKINALSHGVDGKPNVAGFPNQVNHKRNEPNGDMIIALLDKFDAEKWQTQSGGISSGGNSTKEPEPVFIKTFEGSNQPYDIMRGGYEQNDILNELRDQTGYLKSIDENSNQGQGE